MDKRIAWSRVWSSYRRVGLREGLRARMADPAWMLGRQWQFGEFQGDDAASPVRFEVTHRRVPIRQINSHAGMVGGRAWTNLKADDLLEPLIEGRQVIDGPSELRLSGEAGLAFLRLVDAGDRAKLLATLKKLGFGLSLSSLGSKAPPLLRALARGSFDGRKLTKASKSKLQQIAAEAEVNEDDFGLWVKTLKTQYSAQFETAVADDSWQPQSMSYGAAVRTIRNADSRIQLVAGRHTGGAVDWFSFDMDTGASKGAKTAQRGVRTPMTMLPLPVRYAGMPAARYWNFEDGEVYFGDLSAETSDLAQMILTEFATVYSNDWFVIPVPAQRGHLHRITQIKIRDTFDQVITVVATSGEAKGDTPWRFFELSGDPAPAEGQSPWLYLPRAAAGQDHGRDLERLILSRDEEANLAWGIEQQIEGPDGRPVSRAQAWQALRAELPEPPKPPAESEAWLYELAQMVPPHWVPLAPEIDESHRPTGRLLRARLAEWDLLGDRKAELAGPKGRLLAPEGPLAVVAAEIARGGLEVVRQMQSVRGPDGRLHLWAANLRRPAPRSPSHGRPMDRMRRKDEAP